MHKVLLYSYRTVHSALPAVQTNAWLLMGHAMTATSSTNHPRQSQKATGKFSRAICRSRALVCLLLTTTLGFQQILLVELHVDSLGNEAATAPSRTLLSTSKKRLPTLTNTKNDESPRYRAQQPPADALFNNGPVYLQTKTARQLQSHVQCVGETYGPNAWQYRSCRFHFLCYNLSSFDFVVFSQPEAVQSSQRLSQERHLHVSSGLFRHNDTNSVAIGGLNHKWGKKGISRLEWFPKITILNDPESTIQYYELSNSTIFFPFHSLNGANPGHLVWDDYLPMFTLLELFDLRNDGYDLLPIRYVLQDGKEGLWASCDMRPENTVACNHMMTKFRALIAGTTNPYNFTSTFDVNLKGIGSNARPQSDLVCAKTGLAGMGALTDHGLNKGHGWEPKDYQTVHNHGRGASLYAFRNFMIHNLQLPEKGMAQPFRIVFSQLSSKGRYISFDEQITLVKERFPRASVEEYVFRKLSLEKQVEIASQTAIFITACGGGAVTGMFLPKGGNVIVYYLQEGGSSNSKRNGFPAMLDWDVFNAMSYLHVHWMPRSRLTPNDNSALIEIIDQELKLLESGIFT